MIKSLQNLFRFANFKMYLEQVHVITAFGTERVQTPL
jgi:hypothetical protein